MNSDSQVRLANKDDLDQVRSNELGFALELIELKIEKKEVIVCDDAGQITGILRFQWFWDYLSFREFPLGREWISSRRTSKAYASEARRNYARKKLSKDYGLNTIE